jgi:hypothetical protein
VITSPPLTDTQLVLLSASSQREDGLLVQPDRLKGVIAQSVTSSLLARAYIEEVHVGRDEPHWRQDDDNRPIGFKITSIGLIAIGLSGHNEVEIELEEATLPDEEPPQSLPVTAYESPIERIGTKRALVVSLLRREEGADLDDLIQATGWLPHTTRAALTGLRKRGYDIGKRKSAQGRTVYFIKDAEPEEGDVDQQAAAAEAA